MNENQDTPKPTLPHLPDAATILEELAKAKSIDDLTGKDGVFARLFGKTLTAMLEGEMSAHLGYEPYEAKGRNSGNSRNGKRERHLKTSSGPFLAEGSEVTVGIGVELLDSASCVLGDSVFVKQSGQVVRCLLQ